MTKTLETPPTFVILLERDQARVQNVSANILNSLPECQIVSAVDGQTLRIPDVFFNTLCLRLRNISRKQPPLRLRSLSLT